MSKTPAFSAGKSHPLGATVYPDGVNFSLFSKNAIEVDLLLFEAEDHREPSHVIRLKKKTNRTFYYWHCFVEGIGHGQLYGYRVHGPHDPANGYLFDANKVLLDPYTRAVVSDTYKRDDARSPGDNCATAMKSVVIDPTLYDWEGDRPLYTPYSHSILYELHVGGFTKDPSSQVEGGLRGTYRGLIEKIPYLQKLGITTVELLPVQQFDPQDSPSDLPNYWGYAPIALFAPHNGYSTDHDPAHVVDEFRDMVKALHLAGIEVILDVVFNHTAEGGADGPTLSFRGLENRAYYMLEDDSHTYKNYSGTGNTLSGNHSIVRRMIRDCLRHWVAEMHIDGFRFDLASVLTRDENGHPMQSPPLLWEIESDPVLAPTKIIAEPWDLDQYQVGSFIGDKWAEWNGKYRDDVRRFLKGDEGMVRAFANRLMASPDIFQYPDRNPNRSINFVTCHDGFTLLDLVSYNEKHNEANREDNRDGNNANYSWNCGEEGPTEDPAIQKLRMQQAKNFLAILFASQGTPMLSMGDEVLRSQMGNNNAYCQDNELSWMNWDFSDRQKEMFHFVREIIGLNLSSRFFQERTFWNCYDPEHSSVITFHGTRLGQPDFSHHSHSLAYNLKNPNYGTELHVIVNAFWEPLQFELPPLPPNMIPQWLRIIDTAQPHPEDIREPALAPQVPDFTYTAEPRSVVILLGLSRKLSKRVFREKSLHLDFPW